MSTLILQSITAEELYAKIREIIKEELKQDQLLTLEGALKMTCEIKRSVRLACSMSAVSGMDIRKKPDAGKQPGRASGTQTNLFFNFNCKSA